MTSEGLCAIIFIESTAGRAGKIKEGGKSVDISPSN